MVTCSPCAFTPVHPVTFYLLPSSDPTSAQIGHEVALISNNPATHPSTQTSKEEVIFQFLSREQNLLETFDRSQKKV